MKRLTREKDEYKCRVPRNIDCKKRVPRNIDCEKYLFYGEGCPDDCILMQYANRLALYEDAAARGEIPWLDEED